MSKKYHLKKKWLEIFSEQESSGLSIAAFCRKHDIGSSSFYNAKLRLTKKTSESKSPSSKFVEVKAKPKSLQAQLPAKQSCIIESPNGIKITLDSADPEFIRSLLLGGSNHVSL
jgi:hypothetical protein